MFSPQPALPSSIWGSSANYCTTCTVHHRNLQEDEVPASHGSGWQGFLVLPNIQLIHLLTPHRLLRLHGAQSAECSVLLERSSKDQMQNEQNSDGSFFWCMCCTPYRARSFLEREVVTVFMRTHEFPHINLILSSSVFLFSARESHFRMCFEYVYKAKRAIRRVVVKDEMTYCNVSLISSVLQRLWRQIQYGLM